MDNWFYQYKVKVNWYDETNCLYSGIVPASSLTDAVKILEDYYGEECLQEIQTLKPVVKGPVFEFNLATDEDNFDYKIIKKDKV